MKATTYRDFGTPFLGSEWGIPLIGRFMRTPSFGRCLSLRKAIHAATMMMTETNSASAPKPQITHSIAKPRREIHD